MTSAQKQKPEEAEKFPRKDESLVGGMIKDSIPIVGTVRAYKDAKFYWKNGDYVASGVMSVATAWAAVTDAALLISIGASFTGVGTGPGVGGAVLSKTGQRLGVTALKNLALKWGKKAIVSHLMLEEGTKEAIKTTAKEATQLAVKELKLTGKTAAKVTEATQKEVEKKIVEKAEKTYEKVYKEAQEAALLSDKTEKAAELIARNKATEAVKAELQAGIKEEAMAHAGEFAAKKAGKKAMKVQAAKEADLEGAGKAKKAYVGTVYGPAEAGYKALDKTAEGGRYLLEKGSPVGKAVKGAGEKVAEKTKEFVKSASVSKPSVPIVSGAIVRNVGRGTAHLTAKGERWVKKKVENALTQEEAEPTAQKTVPQAAPAQEKESEGKATDSAMATGGQMTATSKNIGALINAIRNVEPDYANTLANSNLKSEADCDAIIEQINTMDAGKRKVIINVLTDARMPDLAARINQ